MHSKKFKYESLLCRYPQCPPETYGDSEEIAFRWVLSDDLKGSFVPINLIKTPPEKMLDETDKMCKGFGLSFFDTDVNARSRFIALYNKKRNITHEDFVADYGDAVAEVNIKGQGICGDFNLTNGHFTFHEFESVELSEKIIVITKIFDEDGKFRG